MSVQFIFKLGQAEVNQDYKQGVKASPYCSFKVGGKSVSSKIASQKDRCLTWADSLVVIQTTESSIQVSLKDKVKFLPDAKIASFTIDLTEIRSSKGISKWYDLYGRYNQPIGRIFLYAEHQVNGSSAMSSQSGGFAMHNLHQPDQLEEPNVLTRANQVPYQSRMLHDLDQRWDGEDNKMGLLSEAY